MKQPLISIIVPVYNGSAYIDGLFTQFAQQPMEGVELVCVDDGSTDGSCDRLLAWREKTPYEVIVHRQENQGVSAARNAGVAKARGEYIAFLDVDDGISTDYISTLLTYARQGIDVLVFASRRVGEDFARQESQGLPCEQLSGEQMLRRFWNDPTRLGVVNLLVRRSYLEEKNITSAVGYKYYEDYDLLLQLFAQTDRILVTDRVLYYYIMREGSAMGRFNADRVNCLGLIRKRALWLEEKAPQFAPTFEKWGTSRLYWSVLWQAALSLPNYREFARFAELTHAKAYLKKLKGYPDRLLQLSTMAFLCSGRAYYLAVQLVGRRRSRVHPASLEDIRAGLDECVAFY